MAHQHDRKKLMVALEALKKIAAGDGICVDYTYDAHPTEKEVAQQALQDIKSLPGPPEPVKI